MPRGEPQKAKPDAKSYAVSTRGISSAKYTEPCAPHRTGHPLLDKHRSINALAECVIGLFKTEVIKQLGPWKTMQDVEWETMHWVDWYNENRLLSSIGYVPPAEAERRHLERTDPVDKVA